MHFLRVKPSVSLVHHKILDLPEAVLSAEPADVAAVDDGSKVVGAPLLPVSHALRMLSVGLGTLDINTSLITQHQLRLVWNKHSHINTVQQ